MALKTIGSETLHVLPGRVTQLSLQYVPPASVAVVQATLRNESGGAVRFNAVEGVTPTPDGEEGSNLLRIDGELDVIGSEDLRLLQLVPAGSIEPPVLRVTYYGTGETIN